MARSRRDDDEDDEDEKPRWKARRPPDDDEDDEPPRKKRQAAKKPVDDEDDEDEDDTPKKKKKPIAEDEDDDGDDDDTPRKSKYKGKGKKKGGLPMPLLIGGIVGLLFLLCGGGATGVYFLFFNDSPKAAVEDFFAAVEKGDGGGMWDRMDKKSQDKLSSQMEFAKAAPENAKHKDKKGRELFVALTADAKDKSRNNDLNPFGSKPVVESYTVESDGKSGSVVVKGSNGRTETVPVIKEDGRWRINLSRMKGL